MGTAEISDSRSPESKHWRGPPACSVVGLSIRRSQVRALVEEPKLASKNKGLEASASRSFFPDLRSGSSCSHHVAAGSAKRAPGTTNPARGRASLWADKRQASWATCCPTAPTQVPATPPDAHCSSHREMPWPCPRDDARRLIGLVSGCRHRGFSNSFFLASYSYAPAMPS